MTAAFVPASALKVASFSRILRSAVRRIVQRGRPSSEKSASRGDGIYLCVPERENCCCGRASKENPPIDVAAWRERWTRLRVPASMPLVLTRCLGPCERANVALVRARGDEWWFGDLCDTDARAIVSFACDAAAGAISIDGRLRSHRFVPSSHAETEARRR